MADTTVTKDKEKTDHAGDGTVKGKVADRKAQLQARKDNLPLQGSIVETAEEYRPPKAYEPRKLEAHDFKTSDDAQEAFLREEIDEDVFSQVVSRLGKPSNRTEEARDRADLSYNRDLPKWAFQTPTLNSPSVEERMEMAEIKEEEKQEAIKAQEEGRELGPYPQTTPHPM